MKVGIIGVGTVGKSVVDILQKNQDLISARAGTQIVVSKGVVKNLSKKRDVNIQLSDNVDDILNDIDIDIVVELMGGIDEPYSIVKKALESKKAVVTANKALLAYHRYELEAISGNTPFEFEASVAGGIPIVGALREGLSANNILSIQGIMNGTCNYMLTRMHQENIGYQDVLDDAQKLGYAEADPTLDVGGFDAGHKLLILASIAYGIDAKPEDILIEGLEGITQYEIEFAKEFNYKIKLLTIAKRNEQEIELRVHLAYIKEDKMIAKIDGVMNGVSIVGDFVQETLYYGAGAGGDATASAVVADIIDIARKKNRSPMLGFKSDLKEKFTLKKINDISTKYYIRLHIDDRAGVLSDVTAVFKDFNISIEEMLQKSILESDNIQNGAILLLSTHICQEVDFKQAIARLQAQECVLQEPFFIRIEE